MESGPIVLAVLDRYLQYPELRLRWVARVSLLIWNELAGAPKPSQAVC